MFWLFIIISAIGGALVGSGAGEGDSGRILVGVLIVLIGVLGNLGVFA